MCVRLIVKIYQEGILMNNKSRMLIKIWPCPKRGLAFALGLWEVTYVRPHSNVFVYRVGVATFSSLTARLATPKRPVI